MTNKRAMAMVTGLLVDLILVGVFITASLGKRSPETQMAEAGIGGNYEEENTAGDQTSASIDASADWALPPLQLPPASFFERGSSDVDNDFDIGNDIDIDVDNDANVGPDKPNKDVQFSDYIHVI